MATVTDVLRTSFEVLNIAAFQRAMNIAVDSTDKLARNTKDAKKEGREHKELLGELGVEHALLAGRMATVGFLLKESVTAFAEAQQQVFRATVQFRNLGNSYPIERAQAFANQMSAMTGIDDEAIVGVQALLKRFGAADDQIQGLTKTVIDFSAGMGISLDEASRAVGHALIGNTRILRNLGVEFKATGDRAKDFATLQQKLAALTGGAAEANLNTLAGAFDGLKTSMGNFFETVGDKISTVLIPPLHALTDLLNALAQHPVLATALTGAVLGSALGPKGAAIGGLAGLLLGLLPSRENPAANIGTGQAQLATEGTLKEVAKNTASLNDTIIQKVLGGPGQVASRAWTYRDQQMAFGV